MPRRAQRLTPEQARFYLARPDLLLYSEWLYQATDVATEFWVQVAHVQKDQDTYDLRKHKALLVRAYSGAPRIEWVRVSRLLNSHRNSYLGFNVSSWVRPARWVQWKEEFFDSTQSLSRFAVIRRISPVQVTVVPLGGGPAERYGIEDFIDNFLASSYSQASTEAERLGVSLLEKTEEIAPVEQPIVQPPALQSVWQRLKQSD